MIISSFRAQYGATLKEIKAMSWTEFFVLLQGIGENTPLARIVQIRLETDSNIIQKFNSSQKRIYSEWQKKKKPANSVNETKALQLELAKMFS